MKVCFLLTHIPNPRMNKRIAAFKDLAETKVICTRRASQDIWQPAQNVPHVILDIDLPSAKHIVKRFLVSRDFQKRALEILEQFQPDVIYAESLDSLLIAGQYKKKHPIQVFFEVADLRENFLVKPANPVDWLLTKALLRREKKGFQYVDYLVVTSPKFYDIHYHTLIPREKMLFIPNAPDTTVFQSYRKKSRGRFTVGFIGGIRYLRQMKLLVDAANAVGADVLFAGAGGTSAEFDGIQEYCKDMTNVRFSGRYDYNREIAELYGEVDCVFSVYDADNPNVRIALPNKLYESIYCELPILVAKNTYLEELVLQYGVGISVSHESREDLEYALAKLKNDEAYRNGFAEKCRACKAELLDTERQVRTIQMMLQKESNRD